MRVSPATEPYVYTVRRLGVGVESGWGYDKVKTQSLPVGRVKVSKDDGSRRDGRCMCVTLTGTPAHVVSVRRCQTRSEGL